MNLLVPVDFSEASQKVIDFAKKLASAFSAKIWLLHVAEPEPDFIGYEVGTQTQRDAVAGKFRKEHRQIQQLGEELRLSGLDCVALLIQGPIVDKILSEADKISADMIVIGSHGKGAIKRLLVGSTSEGVLRKSSIPILVVPTHEGR